MSCHTGPETLAVEGTAGHARPASIPSGVELELDLDLSFKVWEVTIQAFEQCASTQEGAGR
jgi:hypothetical protein